MRYVVVPVTPFEQNCTVVWCAETMRGAAVDPGGDVERILRAADDNGISLEKILLTHGHLDHAGGAADLAKRRGLPIEGPHVADEFWLDGMAQRAACSACPRCLLHAGPVAGCGRADNGRQTLF